jgi:hypothetical protein
VIPWRDDAKAGNFGKREAIPIFPKNYQCEFRGDEVLCQQEKLRRTLHLPACAGGGFDVLIATTTQPEAGL